MKTTNQRIGGFRLLAAAAIVTTLYGCGQRGPLVLPDRTPATVEAPQDGDAADDEADRER
jgi:predicted small lipoprotein YifL